jgi:hypothetical protein
MELDRVPLWRGNHIPIRQLIEDFGRYLYLPRLQSSAVLLNVIRAGLALLTWEQDAFAYAEGYDESASRYRRLRAGAQLPLTEDDSGLLVRPDVARRQIDQELIPPPPTVPGQGPVKPSEETKPITQPTANRSAVRAGQLVLGTAPAGELTPQRRATGIHRRSPRRSNASRFRLSRFLARKITLRIPDGTARLRNAAVRSILSSGWND